MLYHEMQRGVNNKQRRWIYSPNSLIQLGDRVRIHRSDLARKLGWLHGPRPLHSASNSSAENSH